MHILLWFRLAAGEGAMNFSLSQKWNPPSTHTSPPGSCPSPSFLSPSFFVSSLCISRLCFLLPVSFTYPNSVAVLPLYSSALWLLIDFDFHEQLNVSADVSERLSSACSCNAANSLSPRLSWGVKSTRLSVSERMVCVCVCVRGVYNTNRKSLWHYW